MLQPTPIHTLGKGQAVFSCIILVVLELNPDLLTAHIAAHIGGGIQTMLESSVSPVCLPVHTI